MHPIFSQHYASLISYVLRISVAPVLLLTALTPALSLGGELEPYSATYTISRSPFKAERTVELSRDGDEYLLTAKTTLKGLASLAGRDSAVETSRFRFEGGLAALKSVAWNAAGRKPLPKLLRPLRARPRGSLIATKAGSSAASVPSAYVTQAPIDGKPSIVKPVLKKFSPWG